MSKTDDGGPAFPFAAEYGHPAACGGMTLRDWFAGQALAGEITNYAGPDDPADNADSIAKRVYKLADAMLAARKKEAGE